MMLRRIVPSTVATSLAMALVPSTASARGGGGGHGFSGGHFSNGPSSGGFHSHYIDRGLSGGSYHGYYGSSGLITPLEWSIIIIIFMVIMIMFVIPQWLNPPDGISAFDTFDPLSEIQTDKFSHPTGLADGVKTLQAVDPDFDVERFIQRAEMTFMLIRRAEMNNDVALGQAYLSPELFASWRESVESRIASGIEVFYNGLNVRRIDLVHITHDPGLDQCVIHMDVVAGEYFVDTATQRIAGGTPDEIGSGIRMKFTRNSGVKTLVSGGVTAQKCPSCGGALRLNDQACCSYCNARVGSGNFDWTVTSIETTPYLGTAPTPERLFTPLAPFSAFTALQKTDPAFDQMQFVERAKAIFFSVEQAWQERTPANAQAYMSQGVYLAWCTQLEQMARQHRKNIIENLQLLDISPVSMIAGSVFDTVTLKITASAADYDIDEASGKIVFGKRTPQQFTEYWSLQRTIGAVTKEFSLANKQCPQCGAPLKVSEIGECEYCSAAVTSGKFDWVLSRITQEDE